MSIFARIYGGKKEIKIDLRYILFFSLVIIFLQFFASFLSLFRFSYILLFIISLCLSFVTSFLFVKDEIILIFISKIKLLLIFTFSILATFFFTIRLNWGILDLLCPTYLLHMVTQVSDGHFPISFISFPEFNANYHQGFVYLSGIFSYITHISPFLSIKIVLISLFFLITLLGQFFAIYSGNKFFVFPIILWLFSTSGTLTWFRGLNYYHYLHIFEYFGSNSWPISILILFVLLFFLNTSNSLFLKRMAGLFVLVLASSTANATVFSILIITFALYLLTSFIFEINFNNVYHKLRIFLPLFTILISIYFLPKFLPSAFLVGRQYDSVKLSLRFLGDDYFKDVFGYLKLTGPIIIPGFLSMFFVINKLSEKPTLKFMSLLMNVNFFFPLIIKMDNVVSWDNFHKFIVLNLFIHSIYIITTFSILTNLQKKIIIFLCVIVSFLGIPATYDLFVRRTSFSFFSNIAPSNNINDVVLWLSEKEKNDGMIQLIPFGKNEVCSFDGFSAIGSYSGVFVKNSYEGSGSFLLSQKIEDDYSKDINWWDDALLFEKKLNNLDNNEYIILYNYNEKILLNKIDNYNNFANKAKEIKIGRFINFKNISLYTK